MDNNRQRVSMPIRGLDTSSTDINAPDGAMQELHNLRYSGEAWRNVKPFKVVERFRITTKAANLIERGWDASTGEPYIKSRFPVASDIVITAYWYDVDGEYTSTTTATLHVGEQSVAIDESQESFGWIEIDVKEDDYFLYYTPKDSAPIIPSLDDEIIYQHPADEEDVYIARRVQADGTITLLRASIKYGTYVILGVIAEGLPSDITLSHFGKILIINLHEKQEIRYYKLTPDRYKSINIPSAPIIRQSTTLSQTGYDDDRNPATQIIIPTQVGDRNLILSTQVPYFPIYDIENELFGISQFNQDAFWGEICYFAVFQTEGGELIRPGALNISAAEPFYHGYGALEYIPYNAGRGDRERMLKPTGKIINEAMITNGAWWFTIKGGDLLNTDDKDRWVVPFCFHIKPAITISIPEGIDEDIITSVNIYSTRVNSMWDINKIKNYCDKYNISTDPGSPSFDSAASTITSRFDQFFADNKLPEQPFYLLKSIPIKDFQNGKYQMWITASLLEGIEQKTMYNAISGHDTIFESSMEYNSRLHINGVSSILNSGFSEEFFDKEVLTPQETLNIAEITIDDKTYHPCGISPAAIINELVTTKILSYPDYRATYILNYGYKYKLNTARANNFAYCVSGVTLGNAFDFNRNGVEYDDEEVAYVKYNSHMRSKAELSDVENAVCDGIVKSRDNHLRISAANNPFVWPLANSYTIGTEDNEIIAVNAAALEMSDAKFGEFPLYVFTKEGIFAMQSGSGEVLYSAIVPLNYDRIINPNTLAVNYNVLYITSRGVHALFSNESTLLSEAINDAANQPLLEFLATAKMAYQHKFGEVIFYNNDRANGVFKYPNAYTFSLGAKVWGTRDWNAEGDLYTRELLNNGVMIQQGDGFAILSDIHEEESTGTTKFHLLSRPMKFNNQEFKRIETLVARLQADPAIEVNVQLQASNDLVTWVTCREVARDTQYDVNIRRTPFSARYFRVSLECTTNGDVSIMGFDFEYYMRFLHRMR